MHSLNQSACTAQVPESAKSAMVSAYMYLQDGNIAEGEQRINLAIRHVLLRHEARNRLCARCGMRGSFHALVHVLVFLLTRHLLVSVDVHAPTLLLICDGRLRDCDPVLEHTAHQRLVYQGSGK